MLDDDDGWADGLGGTPQERLRALVDLLRHAREDGMSGEDRSICVRQIKRLAPGALVTEDVVLVRCLRRHRKHPQR